MKYFGLLVHAVVCLLLAGTATAQVPHQKKPFLGCSIGCSSTFLKAWAQELNKEVGSFVSSHHRQTIENLASIVEAVKKSGKEGNFDILDKLCRIHKTNRDCLDKCDDDLKQYMVRGLKPLRFLCEERLAQYKASLVCLAEQDVHIRTACLKSTNDLKLVQKHLQDLSNLPFTFRRNLTEQYCVLTREHLNCTITVIDDSCGHNASHVMIDILEKSLEHSDKVVDVEKMKIPLPGQCSRLTTYADELREMIREEEAPESIPAAIDILTSEIMESKNQTAVLTSDFRNDKSGVNEGGSEGEEGSEGGKGEALKGVDATGAGCRAASLGGLVMVTLSWGAVTKNRMIDY